MAIRGSIGCAVNPDGSLKDATEIDWVSDFCACLVNGVTHSYCLQYHAQQYPTLAAMAHDYLAIQGSSVPSERAFSSGGITDTTSRNQLKPETFEAVQIAKGGYRSGILNSFEEARLREPKPWTPAS